VFRHGHCTYSARIGAPYSGSKHGLGGISFSEKLDRILAPFAFWKMKQKAVKTEPMELRGSLLLNHDVQLLATDYLLQMVIIRVTTEGSC
jgi:hypothetical protein